MPAQGRELSKSSPAYGDDAMLTRIRIAGALSGQRETVLSATTTFAQGSKTSTPIDGFHTRFEAALAQHGVIGCQKGICARHLMETVYETGFSPCLYRYPSTVKSDCARRYILR